MANLCSGMRLLLKKRWHKQVIKNIKNVTRCRDTKTERSKETRYTCKLIRWRFVTHGGIDGYSRTVVFLRFSTHSEARTVFSVFTDAVQEERDLPDSVWTDLGRENVDIWCYMVEQHSSISAVITACYAHNERIEHLWLEEENQLDCLNEIGLFRLHQLGFCTMY